MTATHATVIPAGRRIDPLNHWRHSTYERTDGSRFYVSLPPINVKAEHPAGFIHDEAAEAEAVLRLAGPPRDTDPEPNSTLRPGPARRRVATPELPLRDRIFRVLEDNDQAPSSVSWDDITDLVMAEIAR